MKIEEIKDDMHYDFPEQSIRLMKESYDAVESMSKVNETFDISADVDKLEFKIDIGSKGVYTLRFKERSKFLQYFSPISGILDYHYNPKENAWLHPKDKHDFKGIFTRDLLRLCSGCPNFK